MRIELEVDLQVSVKSFLNFKVKWRLDMAEEVGRQSPLL